MDEISEGTFEGIGKRLKTLEKAVLRLTLQNEKRERYFESLTIHIGRMEDRVQYLLAKDGLSGFENWKPKLSPVKDEDGNTD